MAVIGKIQKNSLLLLIVIGVAMLAFIFTDFLKGGPGEIEQLPTATLNEEPIDQQEFEELRESYVNRSKNEYQYQGKDWDEAAERTAADNAFNEIVRRTILEDEFAKLGIDCTTDELNDMIHGDHVHQWVLQIPIFNGPAGFSRDSVRNFLTNLELEPEGASDEDRNTWLESRQQWSDFETELKNARKADKYVALIKKGIYVNKLEAQNEYDGRYTKKQISYVLQRYADIAVDEFTVTDEEIKTYYDAHKNDADYEQEEAREIQMVYFPIAPTKEDQEDLNYQLESLKDDFSKTPNTIGFVYQNSDAQFLSDSAIFKISANDQMAFSIQSNAGSYPASADEAIQNCEIGDVFGPFPAFNSDEQRPEMAILKVVDTPREKQAWVRHILISSGASRTEERAKAISDSLIKVIKANDNFAELVPQVSEDPGSIDNGGEYKWFAEGVMVPAFNDASFNGAIGQLQLVKTSFGYHIVEVLGQAERITPELAIVTKVVRPSEFTMRAVEEQAYDYIYTLNDLEVDSAFAKLAADSLKEVKTTRLFLSNDYVLGVNNSDAMLKFAFNENIEEGAVSDPILDGDKYVVAIVNNVMTEGVPEFEDVKEAMRAPALIDKQAAAYIAKMSNHKTLEDAGAAITNGIVRKGEVTFTSTSVYNGGRPEPAVIGMLFTNIPVSTMLQPVQGVEGVYVFMVDSELEAEETTDLAVTADPMQIKRAQTSDTRVIKALREKANLVDNRRRIKFQ
jgi:parvulin-like peptidyl-prolyl isomerase